MALIESETGLHAEAFGHFAKALDLNPENMIAVYGIIRMGHVTGRLADVVPYLESCLALNVITSYSIHYTKLYE